ncbi:hypothetical protein ASC97_05860 [Rhizobium sp. Root1203]|uniref:hypothetical protein n=1 Tax=Rhizobium sp. Root1203 TaxID=1736427 RepID=UPI0007097A99|nr:hypothetical protein [Rhizobium sp. Root1203]KQV27887.1 hypothetical protein ASC97_05860 [Rhizobium sp. Root1203]
MDRAGKIQLAKEYIAAKIGDIIEKNYNNGGAALETAGTFTALIEAYRAVEIADEGEKLALSKKSSEDYKRGLQTL